MLRLWLPVFFALAIAAPASAQTESASGLARPPERGTRYTPQRASTQAGTSTTPSTALPSPTSPSNALPPPTTAGALPEPGLVQGTENAFAPRTSITAESILGTDDDVTLRMLALDQQLAMLGARRSSGIGAGVVGMILGGTYIGLGVYANRNGSETFAKYLFFSGSAAAANAIVGFALNTNPERTYERFAAIRDDQSLAPVERLRRSEAIFRQMARRKKAGRFTQGSLNLAVAAISLPFLLGDDGFRKADAFDWIVTASAALSAVDAVMTFVSRSEEERRYRMYMRYADTHGGAALTAAALQRVRLSGLALAPMPGGFYTGASFRF